MAKENIENSDIFFREKYELLVQHPLRSKVLRVLKENFKVRELLVIEEKDVDKSREDPSEDSGL